MNEKQIEKIEELGFSVHRDDDDGMYRFSKGSPAGQDFFFEVEPGEDLFELSENVYKYYESYDVSEETALWIDDFGHGKNGAPYDIEDIVADMKECEQYILDSYNLLREMYDAELNGEYDDSDEDAEDFSLKAVCEQCKKNHADTEKNTDICPGFIAKENNEPQSYMTLDEFYEYILENFTLSDEAKRLVKNILDYASCHFFGDDLYHFLTDMLEGSIGLSDAEIRRVSN